VVFAYAGHEVAIVDFKPRAGDGFERLADEALDEVRGTLKTLAGFGLFATSQVDAIASRVTVVPESDAGIALTSAAIILEGVPEVLELKRDVLSRASHLAGPSPSSPRPRPRFWSTICPAPSPALIGSSTRIGSIPHSWCR